MTRCQVFSSAATAAASLKSSKPNVAFLGVGARGNRGSAFSGTERLALEGLLVSGSPFGSGLRLRRHGAGGSGEQSGEPSRHAWKSRVPLERFALLPPSAVLHVYNRADGIRFGPQRITTVVYRVKSILSMRLRRLAAVQILGCRQALPASVHAGRHGGSQKLGRSRITG